jgi:RNA 2',3'-cyclic 3'-phosphodiesterase
MSNKYRLFTAVDIDSSCRKRVLSAIQELKECGYFDEEHVKWVEKENMHITLNFLGDSDETQIPDICRLMDAAAAETPVFDMSVEGLGQFGRGRVIFADLVSGEEHLRNLHRKLTERLQNIGFSSPQKPYKGHLTLCRARKKQIKKQALEVLEGVRNKNFGLFSVFFINLYSSRLTSAGPEYTLIHSSRLSEA